MIALSVLEIEGGYPERHGEGGLVLGYSSSWISKDMLILYLSLICFEYQYHPQYIQCSMFDMYLDFKCTDSTWKKCKWW